ncbi:hypothetical protein BGX34_001682 [Mortierella sp. NVP85]|nr:hypothetical protein BGX34_001682 [Mortierella sp. NVP85]
MADREVSMFHIHGYISGSSQGGTGSSGGYRADHAVQTIWETVTCTNTAETSSTTTGRKKDRQCRVYVMDFTTFWRGTLTRKDWETQRRNRCEDMVNKDMYESLTKDAFKGVPKRDSDKWGLTLSVRSSTLDPDELETILGTMKLEKIAAEESKKILQQWVRTMIEERQKFEHLSKSLRDHVVSLDHQYKECRDLLADFKLDKRRSQSDLMEKFRMLINTKKVKIANLTKSNKSRQDQIERLENALKEERKKRAVLEGKKTNGEDVALPDTKGEEHSDDEDVKITASTKGTKGVGRGQQGRGKSSSANVVTKKGSGSASTTELGLRIKRTKQGNKDTNNSNDSDSALPRQPLPHPQDSYGWDEDNAENTTMHAKVKEEEEEDDEPLVRNSSRRTMSSSTSGLSIADQESVKHRLEDLPAGAQGLIQRVSKAASHVRPADSKNDSTKDRRLTTSAASTTSTVSITSTSSTASGTSKVSAESATSRSSQKRTLVKREDSDQADRHLRRTIERGESDIGYSGNSRGDNSFLDPESVVPRKKHRVSGNDDRSNPGNITERTGAASTTKEGDPTHRTDGASSSRGRGRLPIVSMRKAGATKPTVDKNSLDATPQSPMRISPSIDNSLPSPQARLARTTSLADMSKRASGHKAKDNALPSIASEEDLFKELE